MEYRFLELFINGEYNGLYALGYTPDEKMGDISKNDEGTGFYKRVVGIDSARVLFDQYGGIFGWRAENVPADDDGNLKEKRWKLLMRKNRR